MKLAFRFLTILFILFTCIIFIGCSEQKETSIENPPKNTITTTESIPSYITASSTPTPTTATTSTVTTPTNTLSRLTQPVEILAPLDGIKINTLTPTLEWSPYQGVKHYHIVISCYPNKFEFDVKDTHFSVPEGIIVPPNKSKWRVVCTWSVIAHTASGESPIINYDFIVTDLPIPPNSEPHLVNPNIPITKIGGALLEEEVRRKFPINGWYLNTLTPELEWYPFNEAVYYKVKVYLYDDTYFTTEVTDNRIVVPDGYLLMNNRYYWTVVAYTPSGRSNIKVPISYFNIVDYSVIDLVPGNIKSTSDGKWVITIINKGNQLAENARVLLKFKHMGLGGDIKIKTFCENIDSSGETSITVPFDDLKEEIDLFPGSWGIYLSVFHIDDIDLTNNKRESFGTEFPDFVIKIEE
jgi:hypothetical protein